MATRTCAAYSQHAFLQHGRCRDCGGLESDHPQPAVVATSDATTTGTEGLTIVDQDETVPLAAASTTTFEKPAEQSLAKECSNYTPHAWIQDRCRDCGGSASNHASTVSLAPDESHDKTEDATAAAVAPTNANWVKTHVSTLESNNNVEVRAVRTQAVSQAALPEKEIDGGAMQKEVDGGVMEKEAEGGATQQEVDQANAKADDAAAQAAIATEQAAVSSEQAEVATQQFEASAALLEVATTQTQEAEEAARQAELDAAKEREAATAYRLQAEAAAAEAEAVKAQAEAAVLEAQAERVEQERQRLAAEAQLQAAQQLILVSAASRELHDDTEEQPLLSTSPAPAKGTAASLAGVVEISAVLRNVETLFQVGRNVVRFQGNRPGTFSAIFIRDLTPTFVGQGEYSLCWSKADDRTVHTSRTLHFSEIRSIVLGKQSSVLKQESARSASDRCCVSFIPTEKSHKKSLHLQFGNTRDADTWAYGIASLLKEYGQKPSLFVFGQYEEQAEDRAKDFGESSDDYLVREEDDNAQPVTQAVLDSITLLNQPRKFEVDLAVQCRNLPEEEEPRNTLVTVVDRDDRTGLLLLCGRTELVSDTRDPSFQTRLSLSFIDAAAKSIRFNVYRLPEGRTEPEEEYRIGSALALGKSLVDKVDFEFVLTLGHGSAKRQDQLAAAISTISVTCTSKTQIDPHETEDQRTSRQQLQSHVRVLTQGDQFVSHLQSGGRQDITLRYTPPAVESSSPPLKSNSSLAQAPRFQLGSLVWLMPGGASLSLPLRSVSDVWVGKKPASFASTAAPDEHAFSIASKSMRLDLEAKDKTTRDRWLQAIIALLKAAAAQKDKAAPNGGANAASPHAGIEI